MYVYLVKKMYTYKSMPFFYQMISVEILMCLKLVYSYVPGIFINNNLSFEY